MNDTYDVVVVGARVAGSPTAMLLARAGYRVLLLERARFPRDTLSTLLIHQPGVALLQRWNVLPDVVATGCPPIARASYSVADIHLEGCSWAVDGVRTAFAPRRHLLDAVLARAAVAAGAEFREDSTVLDLTFDGDRVTGVRVRTGGTEYTVRATLVVGADGMRSTVAAKAGAQIEVEDPKLTCAYYTYWSDLPRRFRLYEAPGSWVGTIPTHDGATLVGAYFPQHRFKEVRADALGELLGAVGAIAPELREQMAGGRRLERLHGTGDQRNFFRRASGPGWVLVGDAGHHKDSITARGITDAFRQVQLLVERVGDGLHDPRRLDDALSAFHAQRDAMLTADYRHTLTTAGLSAGKHQLALLRVIAGSAELTDRYFSAMSGACPSDEFVTPELLDLLAAA
ncbi:FAD-dependent oxidoreductase [Streptomyces longispororuber]|uniref:FAD-dependent oxidoreductase n=1 Tax=Streptomyces longispororuber TaxID=68230 RepID=A0A918ZZ19_9ACTN|nr:FAD-dependent oxidoreductase [Streptomyces longispororuber]GHE79534.1 FAD-dependent oxidoreductase [Streptomyces longispororuber]